jgi:hypothetical protein
MSADWASHEAEHMLLGQGMMERMRDEEDIKSYSRVVS